MSILTGDEIVQQYYGCKIHLNPFVIEHVGPNSVDLTLSPLLKRYLGPVLDPKRESPTESVIIAEEGFELGPRKSVLGGTVEECGSDEFVCNVDGRSSMGRLFVTSHVTAGKGDLGFKRKWTLEIVNLGEFPVILYPYMRIAQATFTTTVGTKGRMYTNRKYSEQDGAEASKMYLDFGSSG